jgi:signal transduction histidine kinase
MKEQSAARLAWGISFACFAVAGTAAVLWFLNRAVPALGNGGGSNLIPAVTFAALGGLVASRKPKNPVGWLMLTIAMGTGLSGLTANLSMRVLLTGVAPVGWVRWPAWASNWISNVSLGALILIFLLFPTGKPLSRRWRWVVRVTVFVVALFTLGTALDPARLEFAKQLPRLTNPAGVEALRGFNNSPSFFAIMILLVISAVGLLLRLRRSQGDERQQLKWFVFAVGISVGSLVVAIFISFLSPALSSTLFSLAFNLGFAVAVPLAAALAILRYGLYEIDVVISKTLVYALLAAFFTAVYVAVVVGLGTLIGSAHNTFLTLVAAAVIAIAFNTVRDRARRFADRMVYGKRSTPYEVLSEFSEHMGDTYALDDILPRMATVLAEGTGGRSQIWLRLGDVLRSVAVWPADEKLVASQDIIVEGDEPPTFAGVSKATPVLQGSELLGAITVTKSANDPLRPAEVRLIEDVASQAGLVLRNVRLIEELRASRQRLVKAQDEERRRIERNIHDGAQQQLVALAIKANLAESFVGRDEAKERDMLAQLKSEATSALENLRELARGIYPPLLADKGLAVALESQAKKSVVPATVESDGIGRYPREIEAAVYFCCLEALQNVSKYAQASAVRIDLSGDPGELTFQVVDDGMGFDTGTTGYGTGLQGMADRLEALGGSLKVRSAPGGGTTVTGSAPTA